MGTTNVSLDRVTQGLRIRNPLFVYNIGQHPESITVSVGSPKEFADQINAEAAKWSEVIKAAHLRVN